MASLGIIASLTKQSSIYLRPISARFLTAFLPLKSHDRLSRAAFRDDLKFKQEKKGAPTLPILQFELFMPSNEDTDVMRGQISCQRTTGLSEKDVWEVVRKYVELPRKRTARGRGDISVEKLENFRLELKIIPEPNFWDWRHVDFLYPLADYNKIMEIALSLAKAATPVVKPEENKGG